jgi:hypothetical protein
MNLSELSGGSHPGNTTVPMSGTGGSFPQPAPAVCPGCGRCNTCGRDGASTPPVIPWTVPNPYTPPYYPTWIGNTPFHNMGYGGISLQTYNFYS